MLSEKGSLKETPVMNLLLTAFEEGVTGILYLKSEDTMKVLYFTGGKLVWAVSNAPEDKLEKILSVKQMVAPKNIERVQASLGMNENLGSALVEKGLLTLEELINATKLLIKSILVGVLKWKEGSFSFVKGSPPEGALNLELFVTDFIIDFILRNLNIDVVEKEIGSFQVYYNKTGDTQKLSKYKLTTKQDELLNLFDGQNSLEEVLSKYSDANRESLLKIIYYFLKAGILSEYDDDGTGNLEFDLNDDNDIPTPSRNFAESSPVQGEPKILQVDESDSTEEDPLGELIDSHERENFGEEVSAGDVEGLFDKLSDDAPGEFQVESNQIDQVGHEEMQKKVMGTPDDELEAGMIAPLEEDEPAVMGVPDDLPPLPVDSPNEDILPILDTPAAMEEPSLLETPVIGDASSILDAPGSEDAPPALDVPPIETMPLFDSPLEKQETAYKMEDEVPDFEEPGQPGEQYEPEFEKPAVEIEPPAYEDEVVEEKKKTKQFYFFLFFIALILIVSGVIFLYLNSTSEDKTPAMVGQLEENKGVVEVKEKPVKKASKKRTEVDMKKSTPVKDKKEPATGKKKSGKEAQPSNQTVPKNQDKISKEETGRQLKVLSGDSQAMIHFKKGDFQSAGRIWLSELKRTGMRFTILLELDCMKESVVNAYLRVINKKRFFILRRQRGPRECYLVMWGRFKTRTQAENAMRLVPEFFRSQAYPPQVYSLSPLLD